MAKTAIFLADGFEEIEALAVVDLLRRAQIGIDMISIMPGKRVMGSHQIPVEADLLFRDLTEADLDAYDMLILPGGGVGTKNLEACAPLKEAVARFDAAGKYISAICAAPGIFGRMGLLKGRKATCYPACEEESWGANLVHRETVTDDHILTSRGMGTSIPFGLAIVARFQGEAAAQALAERIVFRA